MNRLYAVLTLVIILFVLCFTEYSVLNSYGEKTTALLKEAEQQYENNDKDKAVDTLNKLENFWKDAEDTLSIFVSRRALEEIGVSIARLPSYAKNRADDDFFCESRLAEVMLTHIKNGERFSVSAIF